MRRILPTLALLTLASTSVRAQAADPFPLKEEAIDRHDTGPLRDSKTYVIPYATLLVSANGSTWATGGNAKFHAKFFTLGLTKALMQDLSLKLHTDLATKLRALGITVLTYDDVKDNETMKGADRRTPDADPRYDGMNTTKDRQGDANYVVATATDEMNIKPALQGAHWGLRNVAKDKQAVLLVPEYWFDTPIVIAKGEESYSQDRAEVQILPGMRLHRASALFLNQKTRGGWIQTKWQPRVSDVVGSVVKGGEDGFSFGGYKRGSADFTLTLDREKFVAGVLKGGYAFNDVIIESVKREMANQ